METKELLEYKKDFIDFLLNTGALKFTGDFTLKSKRSSPWFVNIGDFNDGKDSARLGEFYASSILNSGVPFDTVYGIPEKGSALAVATTISLAAKNNNVPWFFTRKSPKGYGEFSNLPQADRAKALVVGRVPKDGQRIVQLDDVFTAGDAKYEARQVLELLGKHEYPLLAIAVDRMEVAIDGKSAIEEYEQKTGTKVASVVNALDVLDYLGKLAGMSATEDVQKTISRSRERIGNYLRVYGTETARRGAIEKLSILEQRVIGMDRSVIPACDVSTLEQFEALVKATADVEGIGGYKVGFSLGLRYSLPAVVAAARKHTNKPIIYDHQKAGTDIPDTGKDFAKTCKDSGVDTVILFPQAGPETERAWIYHSLDNGLNVIVGGRMTHPAYSVSEGGFITDEGAMEMYRIAARAGINNFVVPGNKPEVITQVREAVGEEGIINPVFYAPGFIAQGGKIEDGAKAAGSRFHGIVGRGIYQAKDMKQAAIEHCSQLT